ncbi:hypothetical protein PsYK624_097420 [Phanerochaete sordida]|uniref:Uncharacterized protein n=1 Tax=Phanerochaete sordida TaxID=48140 RepID=A0A9P3LGZ8_9APHY|nr:hypothetical protein PsYK624_097420 [Phanerochaete sordida]
MPGDPADLCPPCCARRVAPSFAFSAREPAAPDAPLARRRRGSVFTAEKRMHAELGDRTATWRRKRGVAQEGAATGAHVRMRRPVELPIRHEIGEGSRSNVQLEKLQAHRMRERIIPEQQRTTFSQFCSYVFPEA